MSDALIQLRAEMGLTDGQNISRNRVNEKPVERMVRDWEAADRKRGRAFLRERREKHERFWRLAEGGIDACYARLNDNHPVPPSPTKFTYDRVAAVLQAVTVLAEHVTTGTMTPEIKRAWVGEHYTLFPYPPAVEIADHIGRCAAFKKTTGDLVAFVLGKARVRAGMAKMTEVADTK
jgi:hypothetical protein